MAEKIKKGVFIIVGWGLVVAGIIGIFLPIVQGLLLIALGIFFLSRGSETVRDFVEEIRKKFPALDRILRKFDFTKEKKEPKERSPESGGASV